MNVLKKISRVIPPGPSLLLGPYIGPSLQKSWLRALLKRFKILLLQQVCKSSVLNGTRFGWGWRTEATCPAIRDAYVCVLELMVNTHAQHVGSVNLKKVLANMLGLSAKTRTPYDSTYSSVMGQSAKTFQTHIHNVWRVKTYKTRGRLSFGKVLSELSLTV